MTQPRLLDHFSALVQADPGAIALFDGHGGRSTPQPVSREELRDAAMAMADHFKAFGVGAGDCVGVWLPNWSTAVAAQLGALALGAHVIGINTRYNSDEVAHVLDMARPKVIALAHEFNNLDLLGRLMGVVDSRPGQPPAVVVVSAPGTAVQPSEATRYDVGAGAAAFCVSSSGVLRANPIEGLATAFTTSGSTGRSKIAAHTERGVVAHSLAVADAAGIGHESTVLGALPLSGVFGFTPIMTAVLAGARVLLEPVFDAKGVLEDMVACGVTHAAGADDLFGRLQTAWQRHPLPLALRWVGIADFEGRSRDVAAWAEAEFSTNVVGVYGSSELFALTALWPETAPPDLKWSGGGRLVSPEIQFRVGDPAASGEKADEGHEGELQFRGYNVVDTYLGDPALSAGTFTDDGWFRTGDLGRSLGDNTFAYICRMGDVLRLRGFLVDPSEIELRLTAHPAVELAKVVGLTGEDGGTMAIGFVVPIPGANASGEELKTWCAETLAKFKVPRRVYVLDEMPTTSGINGTKVKTATLRQIAATRLAEEPPS
jgi:acyl-CoA synthetase (AMP-forming)/AMP-acid ligase II